MAWTEERTETLKRLWAAGRSARQIADELGDGVTRNAVIGKANRLGLSTPTKKAAPEEEKPVRTPGKKGRTCQWPIGHPGTKGFRFCGKPAEPNRPYCAEHCAIAYRGLSPEGAS